MDYKNDKEIRNIELENIQYTVYWQCGACSWSGE
jgi:hypothetical protein